LMRWNCLLLLFVLCGCDGISDWPRPTSHTIPFETIAIDEGGGGGEIKVEAEPHLVLLTTAEQIVDIRTQVSLPVQNELQLVNFQQYIVIGLFRGRQPTTGYQTTITQIIQHANQLI